MEPVPVKVGKLVEQAIFALSQAVFTLETSFGEISDSYRIKRAAELQMVITLLKVEPTK